MDKTDGTTAYDGWGFTTAFRSAGNQNLNQ